MALIDPLLDFLAGGGDHRATVRQANRPLAPLPLPIGGALASFTNAARGAAPDRLLDLLAGAAQSPLGDRLREHAEWVRPGSAGEALTTPARASLGTLGLLLEGAQAAAKSYSGAGQVIAEKNPLLGLVTAPVPTLGRLTPGGREMTADAAAAFDAADGNLWARVRAANEGGASRHPYAQGLLNAAEDPGNLLGPLGKGLQGTKFVRAGRLLSLADDLQALPYEALAKLAAPALKAAKTTDPARRVSQTARLAAKRLARMLPPDPLFTPPTTPAPGGGATAPTLVDLLIPASPPANARDTQYGDHLRAVIDQAADNSGPSLFAPTARRGGPTIAPVRPTPADVPTIEALLLDPLPRRRIIEPHQLLPPEAITRAEERAARALAPLVDTPPDFRDVGEFPSYGFSSLLEALAEFSGDELDRLLSLAYPTDEAIGNALNKYQNPVELADAALARISGDRRLLATLARTDDALARKLAYLPEPDPAAARAAVAAPAGAGGASAAPSMLDSLGGEDDLAWLADNERLLDEIQLETIEQSPYALVFKYFNPNGELKKVNPLTGQRLTVRNGGKFSKGRAEIWNLDGSGYDVIAANIMDEIGGANQNYATSAEDFWRGAQETFLEYQALKRPRQPIDYSGGDLAAGGGGMGIVGIPGGISGPVGKAMAPALFGAGHGMFLGGAAGVSQGESRGERLANMLRGMAYGGAAGFVAGGAGSMATISPELRHVGRMAAEGAVAGALPGAVTSGTVGALAGATQGDGVTERAGNAVKGGAAGAASGAIGGATLGGAGGALFGKNTSRAALRQTLTTGHELALAAQAQAVARNKAQPILKSPGTFWRVWRADTVQHPKNLQQDELFGSTVTALGQGRGATAQVRAIRDDLAARMRVTDPWQAQPTLTQNRLTAIGKEGYAADIGTSLVANEKALADEVSALETMQAGAIASLLSPRAINPAGVAVGAGKGYFAAYRDKLFRALNGVANASHRYAVFNSELDNGLVAAERQLQQRFPQVGGLLPEGGAYTPAQVRRVAGQQAGDLWESYTDAVVMQAEDRAKFLLGDYGRQSRLEEKLGGAVPFASWAIRAYPVALAMMVEHPAVALLGYHLLRATSEGAGEEGRPGYTAGMIGVPSDMPLIGPALQSLMGGQAGVVYIDPIGMFSPLGGDLLAPGEEGERSKYQQASDLLGRVGLPGFHPLIKAGAYATGLDYRAPGNFSRTQGLEDSLGLIPGMPQLPSVADATLRGVRTGVSPMFAESGLGELLGAEGDRYPSEYDPITRRYGELVLEQTGKTLDEPANRRYLLTLGEGDNPLWQRARVETLASGAARNAFSLTAPIGAVAVTESARANRAAKQGQPFTYDEIQRAKATNPAQAKRMQAEVDRYNKANPGAVAYRIGSQSEADAVIMQEILARYRRAGVTPTKAGIAEQLRLMRERAGLTTR